MVEEVRMHVFVSKSLKCFKWKGFETQTMRTLGAASVLGEDTVPGEKKKNIVGGKFVFCFAASSLLRCFEVGPLFDHVMSSTVLR